MAGTTLNLLKFPIMNPKPTVLQRRADRLRDEKTLIDEEEKLRKKLFKETPSAKYATLMGESLPCQHRSLLLSMCKVSKPF